MREPITPSGVDASPSGGLESAPLRECRCPPARPPPAGPTGRHHIEVVAGLAVEAGGNLTGVDHHAPPHAMRSESSGRNRRSANACTRCSSPPPSSSAARALAAGPAAAAHQHGARRLDAFAHLADHPDRGLHGRPPAPAWATAAAAWTRASPGRLMPAEARPGSRRERGSPAARRSTSDPPGCVIRRSS